MKKMFLLFLVMIFSVSCLQVFADDVSDETKKWDEIYMTDFEGGELDSEFYENLLVLGFDESNIATENDNTYYAGHWPAGANMYSAYAMEDVRLEFDIRTGSAADPQKQNAYKAGLQLVIPEGTETLSYEPDNLDDDKSSYLGCGGICIYMYDSVLEVVIRSNKAGGQAGPVNGVGKVVTVEDAADRMFSMYGVGYQFTLPEGKTFAQFTSVAVELRDGVCSVIIEDELFCTVELSQIENLLLEFNINWNSNFAGGELLNDKAYRKAVVKDAKGDVVLTVEDAVVPTSGAFAFVNRGPGFDLDNLHIYEEYVAPKPTQVPVATAEPDAPEATQSPTEAPAEPTNAPVNDVQDSDSSGNNILIIVLICAIGVVVVIIIIIMVVKQRKQK